MTERFEDRCIISGIGQSDVGRRVTKGVMALTLDAVLEAIADAGLKPADIDGVMSWPGAVTRNDSLAPSGPGGSGPGPHAVIDALRLQPTWYYGGPETPGMFAAVIHACMAVATGMCRHVVVYRALNEATAWRTVTDRVSTDAAGVTGPMQWMLPFGAFSGPNWMGLWATRHMHEFGTTREQIAAIALNGRRNAQRNPKAVLQGDLTMDDYLASKMISDPLCLFDCDIAVDGVTALIVSTARHAPDVPTTPIHFEAVGSALHGPGLVGPVGGHDARPPPRAPASTCGRGPTSSRPTSTWRTSTTASASSRSSGWRAWASAARARAGRSSRAASASRSTASCRWPPAAASSRPAGCTASATSTRSCLQLRGQAEDRQVKDAKVAVTSAGAGPLASCLLLRTDA